ncbi:deuterolysin M35 metalloprotease [Panaeolus papilionaceus]|nr:deuterolysin M35 metalloprotease [Panaeolus papilionaceus]
MVSCKSVLASLVIAAVSVSASPALTVTLSAPTDVSGVQNLKVTARITNVGDETIKLLEDPRSLASKSPVNKFKVANRRGGRPSFNGIKIKYSPEVAARMGDFTVLAPGASLEVVHDLSEAYNFTTAGAGAFDFEGDSQFYIINEDESIGVVQANEANSRGSRVAGNLSFTSNISGNLVVARDEPHLERRATFIGCSASRQTLINTAAASAKSYASASLSYLNALTSGKTRYTTWFGAYDTSRLSTARSHFNLINSNDINSYTWDCSTCTQSAYAYVYPGTFGKIYLCSAFWNAPNTGTDSKAGTIIHEASHFTRNGGTDDLGYGHTNAKNLAKNSPAKAVMNADNHEYFAENNPVLS